MKFLLGLILGQTRPDLLRCWPFAAGWLKRSFLFPVNALVKGDSLYIDLQSISSLVSFSTDLWPHLLTQTTALVAPRAAANQRPGSQSQNQVRQSQQNTHLCRESIVCRSDWAAVTLLRLQVSPFCFFFQWASRVWEPHMNVPPFSLTAVTDSLSSHPQLCKWSDRRFWAFSNDLYKTTSLFSYMS